MDSEEVISPPGCAVAFHGICSCVETHCKRISSECYVNCPDCDRCEVATVRIAWSSGVRRISSCALQAFRPSVPRLRDPVKAAKFGLVIILGYLGLG
jgi:hypothetical protein